MTKHEEVFQFLKEQLLSFLDDVSEEAITEEGTFESLDLESLDFVDLQVEFGKKYRVTVAPSIFASGKVRTLGQLVDHVVELLERQAVPAVAGSAS